MSGSSRPWAAALRRAAAEWARRDVGELLAIAAEALGRYKLRTALSILGIVLGVAAVISMMSVSDGARRQALQQVELLGLDNLVVRSRPVLSGPAAGQATGLTIGDVDRLRALVPLAARVAPLVERYTAVAGPARRQAARVLGVTAEYGGILRLTVARGRLLAALDDRGGGRVCVLGAVLARALFGLRNPLGESVRIESYWYQVVGVLEDRAVDARVVGTIAARDLNTLAFVPLTALPGVGADPRQKVDEIWLQVSEGGRVAEVGRILDRTLFGLHRGVADFEVVVPRELLAQRQRTQRTFSVVVGSVAVLSLLVGGIGIMNIMLASVLERTREIGIRRTVGATRRDVTLQFLTESLLMTVSGGLAGILLGVAVSWGITAYAGWRTWISPASVLLAICVSFAVGLGFGIYPARKAASLAPIDAVRYE